MSSGSGARAAPAVAAAPRRGQRGQTRKAPEGSGQSAPAAKAQKAVSGDVAQQAKASWADVVAGRVQNQQQVVPVLIAKIQQLEQLVQNHQAINDSRRDDFLQFRTATSAQIEQTLRYSKRRNLVVFGVAESSAYTTPGALAAHLQDLLFEGSPSSTSFLVGCAYRLGKWKSAQKKPRAVLVELTSVSAKHRAFQASKRLRATHIRLDDDLSPQQMQQRRGLSSDFLCLKTRGFKPFFRGTTLKYRDGLVLRSCARGEANKIRPPAPTVFQPRPAQKPAHAVAVDPTEVLRQAGVSVSTPYTPLVPGFGPFTVGTSLGGSASLLDTDDAGSEFLDCASDSGHAGDRYPLDSVSS